MPNIKSIGHVILEDSYSPTDIDVVEEKRDRIIAKACLQEAEEENRNGRCYRTDDLHREQTCKRTIELLQAGYMLGEAGHPTDSSIIRQQTIDPANVAVRYLKFWMEGPKWMAHFEGTNNELGETIDKDLRKGFKPAFSMRALGTLENMNGRNVVRDLKYITHDFVIFPSHPGAYTQGIVSESAELYKRDKKSEFNEYVKERGQKIIKEARTIPIMNEEVISYIKTESANIRSILEQFEVFYDSIAYDPKRNKVTMKTKNNEIFIINCESYIQNEIQNYCSDILKSLNG